MICMGLTQEVKREIPYNDMNKQTSNFAIVTMHPEVS